MLDSPHGALRKEGLAYQQNQKFQTRTSTLIVRRSITPKEASCQLLGVRLCLCVYVCACMCVKAESAPRCVCVSSEYHAEMAKAVLKKVDNERRYEFLRRKDVENVDEDTAGGNSQESASYETY